MDSANTIRQEGIKLVWFDLTLLQPNASDEIKTSKSRTQFAFSDRINRAGGIYKPTDEILPNSNLVSNLLEDQTTTVYELTYKSHSFNDGENHQVEITYESSDHIKLGSSINYYQLSQSQFATTRVRPYLKTIFLILAFIMLLILILIPFALKTYEET